MKRGKKFISLFLVFSFMMLSVNLYAEERRGAQLLITKKNGLQIECELLIVKMDSLIWRRKFSADHITTNIRDIKTIRIIRKSKALLGAGTGFLVGGSIGALAVAGSGSSEDYFGGIGILIGIGVLGGIGALCGAGIGASEGTDIKIQIEGMTDLEIQEALDKLRKKARFRYYEPYPRIELNTEKKAEAAELKIEVKLEGAILRLWPHEESEIVTKVPFGTVFKPERKIREWYQVSFRDKSGFVLSGYIHESNVFVMKEIKKVPETQETLDKLPKKARNRDFK